MTQFLCWLYQQGITLVHGLGDLLSGPYNLPVGNDLATLQSRHASGVDMFLAVVDLASNALVLVPVVGDEAEAVKIAEVDLHTTGVEVHELTYSEAADEAIKVEGCGCFPGTTGVLTARGLVAIAGLHAGDQVLAENPRTGKVEPRRVQAVIDDGIKPLMAMYLSDGSSLSVTTNHPFYVDGGPGITGPGWMQAGDLRDGDRIRIASGQDVAIVALRYHVGYAHVYTLTVATDHDFFVGSTHLLVHNSFCGLTEPEVQQAQQAIPSNDLNHIFGKEQHNLAPLVTQLGSQSAVVEAVLRGINKNAISIGRSSDQVVTVEGYNETVRAVLVNGVVRIGTLFIPK